MKKIIEIIYKTFFFWNAITIHYLHLLWFKTKQIFFFLYTNAIKIYNVKKYIEQLFNNKFKCYMTEVSLS